MAEFKDKTKLYSNVLYEILHAIGNDAIKKEDHQQIFELLRNAFGFDLNEHEELLKKAQEIKEKPLLVLRVDVIAAKNLKATDCNGLSDPFCEIFLGNEVRQTNYIEKTLNPTWNQTFEIPINNLQKDVVKFHVRDYNKPDLTLTEKVGEVREVHTVDGIKQFAKNLVTKNTNRLIGTAKTELKTLPTRSSPTWHILDKKRASKKSRGEILLNLSLVTASSWSPFASEGECQSYVSLLVALLANHLAVYKVIPYTWKGEFTIHEDQVLTQHVIQSRVLPHQEDLAKFVAFSQVHSTHPLSFQIFSTLLQNIVGALKNRNYSKKEEALFWQNTRSLLCSSLTWLTKLTPVSLEDTEKSLQLNDVLSIVSYIKTLNPPERMDILPASLCPWRISNDEYDLTRGLHDTVTAGIRRWFQQIHHNNVSYEPNSQEALSHLERTITLVMSDLSENVPWTDEFFKLNLKFPYQETIVLFIDTEISALTRAIVQATGNKLIQFLRDEITDETPTKLGNALFQLYHVVQELGRKLHELVPQAKLNIKERHSWFREFIIPRLEIAINRIKFYTSRYVENDKLLPVCTTKQYTSSAVDSLALNCEVKQFLVELEWPDSFDLSAYVVLLISGICDCCIHYAEEMTRRVLTADNDFIICLSSIECCRAINSIEKARQYLMNFLNDKSQETLRKALITCGHETEAENLSTTLLSLVESSQAKMSQKTYDLVHTLIIREVEENTSYFLKDAARVSRCEKVKKKQSKDFDNFLASTKQTLLNLDENLCGEHREKIFIYTVNSAWSKIVSHFTEIVDNNVKNFEPPSFFVNLRDKLRELEIFFSDAVESVTNNSADWVGNSDEITNELKSKLHFQSMGTSDLISSYHKSRISRQDSAPQTYGMITFKCHFSETSLHVEILNLRDVEYENSADNCRLYVKLKLLPEITFPLPRKQKTNIKKLYQKTITFDVGSGFERFHFLNIDAELQTMDNAILQLIVMEDYKIGKNKFIGEAFYPFSSISRELNSVEQIHLTLSRPYASTDLPEFKVLSQRYLDVNACVFVEEENMKSHDEFTLID